MSPFDNIVENGASVFRANFAGSPLPRASCRLSSF